MNNIFFLPATKLFLINDYLGVRIYKENKN